MVHAQRLLKVLLGVLEVAQQGGEDAEGPIDGVESELGDGDGILRPVRQKELVEGRGARGVVEDRAGLREQADAGEPLLVDVPVREFAAR